MTDKIVLPDTPAAPEETPSMLRPFNADALYEVNTFTDLEAGKIDVYTPVTNGGVRDTNRSRRFFSSIVAAVRGRPMRVDFELKADTLAEAVAVFQQQGEEAARAYLAELEAQALRTKLASGAASAQTMAGALRKH